MELFLRQRPLFMADRTRSKLTYPRAWKLRIACAALIAKWIAGLTAIACLVLGFVSGERPAMLTALAAIGAFVGFATLALVLANELPCNVCRQPLLLTKRCRKHVKARCFLGISHALGVAIPALFTNRYHCMHCGEKIPLTRRRNSISPADSAENSPVPAKHATDATAAELPAPR